MNSKPTSRAVRSAFLNYFERQGHSIVRSGPLVPPNDPTLMFANAGMVQFKDVFTGRERRDYSRATTSQKCMRLSGKHNDLENVGVTARHHTLFEMLGNFSFGDYFKADAIRFAWELLTKEYGLEPERMAVTVFAGDGPLPADTEAEQLWRELAGVKPDRIFRMGAADNFWQMGDTGPCGPCSEIHYYLGDDEPNVGLLGHEPGADGRGWIELWNLVFMQYNREAGGRLDPLPAPSIDTGAGLERVCAVLQARERREQPLARRYSNYETDLLAPMVQLGAELARKPYQGSLTADDISIRVLADHARATAFLIAEGVFPDRDGRPYVLRRVMRRAIHHGHRLGIRDAFFHRVTDRVVDVMGDVYPELVERRALISDIVSQEEERFRRTLDRGLELLEKNSEWSAGPKGERVLPGARAFMLYDTYGFPLDLQEVIGRERSFEVDRAGFEAELERARERSAGSKIGDGQIDAVYHDIGSKLPETRFVGYEVEEAQGKVLACLTAAGSVSVLEAGNDGELVVDVTPFYAESGGQIGDTGTIETESGAFEVRATHRPRQGLIVHAGKVTRGRITPGQVAALSVDHARRQAIRRNHSATHLLHYALRKVVGPHAMQKGSLVAPERLRFDFSATKPLSRDERAQIERLVNEKVYADEPVTTDVLGYDDAKNRGAIGIFEEKYGDVVRMLTITPDSIELCGGTHVRRTGEIGSFKIVLESSVAAGVRRIEAVTGAEAVRYVQELENRLYEVAEQIKSPVEQLSERVARLVAQQKELTAELAKARQKQLTGDNLSDLLAKAEAFGDTRVLGASVDIDDPKSLRELSDRLRDKLAPAAVLLGSKTRDGKAVLVCSVSQELSKRLPAGSVVNQAAQVVGGKGGGRPDFAQAGGPNAEQLSSAVQTIYSLAQTQLRAPH